jgi:hypothetical protein
MFFKKWLSAFVGVALCLTALPAFAAPACYKPAEMDAEQLLRLHSELMVITVTCKVGSRNEDLVPAYTGFTSHNITALHAAEHTMIRWFEAHGGHGQDRLDRLRTTLGNEYGQRIADSSAQKYCDVYRDKVLEYYGAPPAAINDEVHRMVMSERPYTAACK